MLILLLLKRALGSSLTFFSSERPHVQLHSVPLHPVGPLVQSCHGEKNVTFKDLETTSAAFLVFLENLLFKYKIAPALLRTGMSTVWDLDVFFAFLLIKLIRYFRILVIKLEYLQIVIQEARKLFTGRQESRSGSTWVFDCLIFLCRPWLLSIFLGFHMSCIS